MAAINYKDLFDFSDPSEIEKAVKAIEKLQKAYPDFLKESQNSSGLLTKKMEELIATVEKSMAIIQKLEPTNAKHKKTLEEVSASVVKQAEEYKQLNETQKKYEQEVKNLTKSVSSLEKENERLRKKLEDNKKGFEAQAGSLKDLQNQLKQARKEQDNLNKANDPEAYRKAEKEVLRLTSAINQQKKENREAARTFGLSSDSLEGMRVSLNQARRSYDQLSREQRENDMIGGELLRTIQQLDEELKELEKQTGRTQRSVGDYKEQAKQAINETINLSGGLGSMGAAFQAARANVIQFYTVLAANPIGAIIATFTALAAILVGLFSKFASTEKGAASVAKAFGILKDITKPLTNALEVGAEAVGSFFTSAVNLVADLISSGDEAADTYANLAAKLAEVEKRQRALEASNKALLAEAERLKNIRDEESRSINERIAANEQLAEVEQKRLTEGFEVQRDLLELQLRQLLNQKEVVLTTEQQAQAEAELNRIANSTAETYDISGERLREMNDFLHEIGAEGEDINKFSATSLELNDLIEDSYGRQNEQIVNQFQLRKELLEFENEAAIAAVDERLAKVREGTEEEKQLLIEKIQLEAEAEIRQVEFSGRNEEQKQAIIKKILAEAQKERLELEKEFNDEFLSSVDSANKIREKLEKQTNDILTGINKDGIQEQIDQDLERLQRLRENQAQEVEDVKKAEEEKRAARQRTAELSKELAGEAIGLINQLFDARQADREKEFTALEEQEAAKLELAGDNEEAQEQIQKEFAAKRAQVEAKARKDQKRQAEFNKIIALAEIAFNTAEGISKAVAASPLTGGLPFSAIIAGIGAAQAATVLATPIPAFKKGRKGNLNETMAIVNEEGQEIGYNIRTKKARFLGQKGNAGPELEKLDKYEAVLTAKESSDFVKALDESKISMPSVNVNAYNQIQRNTTQSNKSEPFVNYGAIARTIAKTVTNGITVDQTIIEDGQMKRYIKKAGSTIKTNNARRTLKRGNE